MQVDAETQDYREKLGRRLSEVVDLYETKSAAASAAGVTAEQLNKWLKGGVKIPAEAIRSICLGVDADFSSVLTGEMTRSLAGSAQMIRLPVYGDVQAAAGVSSIPASELAEGVMSFDRRFLRDQGAAPEHCSVIWAKGDSMTPTIPDGSALVVDRSQTAISNGCIMVIGVGDDLLVKRVRRRLDGLVELLSDNASYPPETLGPDSLQQLRVVGRVVYFCRTP